MNMIKCKFCEEVTKVEHLQNHPTLVFLNSDSGWTETYNLYYCSCCHSLFEWYMYSSLQKDSDVEHQVECLTDHKLADYQKGSLHEVGRYLRYCEKLQEIKEMKQKEGSTVVYLHSEIPKLKRLQQGEHMPTEQLCYEIEFSLSPLARRYWSNYFYARSYYVKLTVPNDSLQGQITAFVGGLGSGSGGFAIKSSYLAAAEDIEVYDPKQKKFIPLPLWDIPPVYTEDATVMREIRDWYEPIRKEHTPLYEAEIQAEEHRIKTLTEELYREIL